MRVTNLVY